MHIFMISVKIISLVLSNKERSEIAYTDLDVYVL